MSIDRYSLLEPEDSVGLHAPRAMPTRSTDGTRGVPFEQLPSSGMPAVKPCTSSIGGMARWSVGGQFGPPQSSGGPARTKGMGRSVRMAPVMVEREF